jgi:hypothetical protein
MVRTFIPKIILIRCQILSQCLHDMHQLELTIGNTCKLRPILG